MKWIVPTLWAAVIAFVIFSLVAVYVHSGIILGFAIGAWAVAVSMWLIGTKKGIFR